MSNARRVQQDAMDLQACQVLQATAAINNAVTCTIPAPEIAGQSIYLCGLDLAVVQDNTSTVNTLAQFTSTNLFGWAWKYSLAATANLTLTQPFAFPKPVKAQMPNQPITIVSPAAKANTSFSINAYYYVAP